MSQPFSKFCRMRVFIKTKASQKCVHIVINDESMNFLIWRVAQPPTIQEILDMRHMRKYWHFYFLVNMFKREICVHSRVFKPAYSLKRIWALLTQIMVKLIFFISLLRTTLLEHILSSVSSGRKFVKWGCISISVKGLNFECINKYLKHEKFLLTWSKVEQYFNIKFHW